MRVGHGRLTAGHAVACISLGLLVGAVGVIVSPGPVSIQWLGVAIALAIVASGSLMCGEWAGLGGGLLYACAAEGVTIWLLHIHASEDMLTLPSSVLTSWWPAAVLVAGLVPLSFMKCGEKHT